MTSTHSSVYPHVCSMQIILEHATYPLSSVFLLSWVFKVVNQQYMLRCCCEICSLAVTVSICNTLFLLLSGKHGVQKQKKLDPCVSRVFSGHIQRKESLWFQVHLLWDRVGHRCCGWHFSGVVLISRNNKISQVLPKRGTEGHQIKEKAVAPFPLLHLPSPLSRTRRSF